MVVDRGGLHRPRDPRPEAWAVALDRIELDVIRAEKALDGDQVLHTDVWDVPDDYGPLPEHLRPRAQRILERQQALLSGMADRLGYTHRQQALTERVGRVSQRDRSQAIYVDVSA